MPLVQAAPPISVDSIPEGTHMCLIYKDEAERIATVGRFVAGGLSADGTVGYFGNFENDGGIARQVRALGVDLDAAARNRRFSCNPARDTYVPDGRFDSTRMLSLLATSSCACRARAPGPVLFSGEMAWALDPDIDGAGALARYEQGVNRVVNEHPFSAICQYDAARFDAAALYLIMKAHPYVVTQGQIVANPLYDVDADLPWLDRLST